MADKPESSHVSWPEPTVEVQPAGGTESVEVPPEDAAEQAREAASQPESIAEREVPIDVDPADVAEQAREIGDDEDEYR